MDTWRLGPERFQRKQCQVGSKYTKRYSEEYKRDAVELVRSSERTVTDVARQLDVSAESLRAWVKKAKAAEVAETGGNTTSARGSADERDEELKRLRKLTVEQAKTIEILKKATAFFAKESDR
ncbi:transposase [Streptomyces sp. NPDC002012]|uniref:transposase n=1 Tax=Streptomyces sp. NPDC002012 TaxID=3154532 RepID=UPI0033216708